MVSFQIKNKICLFACDMKYKLGLQLQIAIENEEKK